MQIRQIISNRSRSKGRDRGIVDEWEDIFSEKLNLPLYYDDWKRRVNIILYKFPWIAEWFMQTWKNSFIYVMQPLGNPSGYNKKNIIPCIIDFFLKEDSQLNDFYTKFSKSKIVFISSKEAYDFLIEKKCPLNIKHLALSISDKYKIKEDTIFEKEYDVVMLGRQNSVLKDFLAQYKITHKDLTYVYGENRGRDIFYYDQDGKELGILDTRDKYMSMMRKSRVGLYGTPGMDGSRSHTNGFSQVTPRFLEYLVSGCHVLARYVKNSDTDYYELDKMAHQINNYDDFEIAMDYARNNTVDIKLYMRYLEKHYTSERVKKLQYYLEKL